LIRLQRRKSLSNERPRETGATYVALLPGSGKKEIHYPKV